MQELLDSELDQERVISCSVALEWIWKYGGGAHIQREASENVLRPSTFLALQVQLGVYASAFVMVSTQFAVLLTVPPCPVICKSGGTCSRALWSRRHCSCL